MKTIALTVIAIVSLSACSEEADRRLPTGPVPPPNEPGLISLWGMVVDESGVCIAGATVTVVGGQGLGHMAPQSTPCDAWSYSGGFVLEDLAPGVEIVIRASAPGYDDEEKTIVPFRGPQTAVLFAPASLTRVASP